jgi:hypothetical protein
MRMFPDRPHGRLIGDFQDTGRRGICGRVAVPLARDHPCSTYRNDLTLPRH